MIRAIGIDSVEISRFTHWLEFSYDTLSRILSREEIAHCQQLPIKAAERFAARFAAREAFFKALESAYPDSFFPFLRVCRALSITHTPNGAPCLSVNWLLLAPYMPQQNVPFLISHISLTHTRDTATAFVILCG